MIHNKFSKLLIVLNIIIYFSNCQLKIPLKYFPYYKYNDSTPSTIFLGLVKQQLYANIEIGTPKRTIQIPLAFDSNDFYIADSPKNEYEFDRFNDLMFYNASSSSSFYGDEDEEDYYSYQGELFEVATYQSDIFYFNNKKYTISFYVPLSYREVNSGGIGMLLLPYTDTTDSTPNPEKTFYEKLRKLSLVKQYYWSIFYNSQITTKEEEGFLLLGALPHEIKSDLGYFKQGYFSDKYEKTVNIAEAGQALKFSFDMDSLYAYEGNNKNKKIEDFSSKLSSYKKIELDYHSGGVIAPGNVKTYYHRVFEEYLSNGECLNETTTKNKITFYYCKNNKETISKIKRSFPGINFRSNDLNYTFTLDSDDLFIEEKGYVFFFFFFSSSSLSYSSRWTMGKPFLRKYPFTVNIDQKYFTFYYDTDLNKPSPNEGKSHEGISTTSLWIIICCTVVIISILSFLIFRFFLYEKYFKKKRANELDDDYDYIAKNASPDGLNINN